MGLRDCGKAVRVWGVGLGEGGKTMRLWKMGLGEWEGCEGVGRSSMGLPRPSTRTRKCPLTSQRFAIHSEGVGQSGGPGHSMAQSSCQSGLSTALRPRQEQQSVVQPWPISEQLAWQWPNAQAGLQVSQSGAGKSAYATEDNKVSSSVHV